MMSWALGAFLAALAGILITPIQGSAMSANALTLLVIDAFAAAMFGRLRSLPRTFVGAIVLGLAGSYVIGYFPADRWTWTGNFRLSLPMILLFVILLFLPQDRLRGATVLRDPGALPRCRRCAAPWSSGGRARRRDVAAADDHGPDGDQRPGLRHHPRDHRPVAGAAHRATPARSTWPPLSFGAIGTIVVLHFGVDGTGIDARMTLWGFLAGRRRVRALVGALVALPALRLRGLYLALATMAFGVFVSRMVLREIGERKLPLSTRGSRIFPSGSLTVPRPKFGPLDLKSTRPFLMLVTVVFAVLGIGLVALRHSGYGRRLAAMKDSPAACATLGMSVVRSSCRSSCSPPPSPASAGR